MPGNRAQHPSSGANAAYSLPPGGGRCSIVALEGTSWKRATAIKPVGYSSLERSLFEEMPWQTHPHGLCNLLRLYGSIWGGWPNGRSQSMQGSGASLASSHPLPPWRFLPPTFLLATARGQVAHAASRCIMPLSRAAADAEAGKPEGIEISRSLCCFISCSL